MAATAVNAPDAGWEAVGRRGGASRGRTCRSGFPVPLTDGSGRGAASCRPARPPSPETPDRIRSVDIPCYPKQPMSRLPACLLAHGARANPSQSYGNLPKVNVKRGFSGWTIPQIWGVGGLGGVPNC